MSTQTALSVIVELTILKPVAEVFAAILTPVPYFVEKASGPLEEGETVEWTFAEMPKAFEVRVTKVVPDRLISLEWDSATGGLNTCDFRFARPQDSNPDAQLVGLATTVTVIEAGWTDDDKGLEASYRNQAGWMQMLCSLKAWLEHRVNLRQGAFSHMQFNGLS